MPRVCAGSATRMHRDWPLQSTDKESKPAMALPAIEPLLFTTTRLSTFRGRQSLTAATAFFFSRGKRLFLVTSRHVLHDEPTGHFPDRIEVVFHVDATNLTRVVFFSILLYKDSRAVWRQGI